MEGLNPMEKIRHALTEVQIAAIENSLNRGNRVEIIPVKDGLKILNIRREVIKAEKKDNPQ